MKPGAGQSAFSRPLDVHSVPNEGLETSIEATLEECTAIAREVAVPAVGTLKAEFKIAKRPGGRFKVDGIARARISQICVVSLEPFDSEVDAPIDVIFAPSAQREHPPNVRRASRRRSPRIEPQEAAPPPALEGEDDPPDPIIDGRIDLGAVAVEFLTLALDFYPRKPGVQFSDVVTSDTRPSRSAFAALERLKDRS